MKPKIFIDGEHGTTGLQIRTRLAGRNDLEVISVPAERRKDPAARADYLNAADVAILCLPDDAAKESVSLITNETTRVIDASTAFRVADGWTYGFAEMDKDQARAIADSKRVANPGCWPQGPIATLRPLVKAGLLPAELPVSMNGISGYSGGGRTMIEDYEAQGEDAPEFLPYALSFKHKHVPELKKYAGLSRDPLMQPVVGNFAQGMITDCAIAAWHARACSDRRRIARGNRRSLRWPAWRGCRSSALLPGRTRAGDRSGTLQRHQYDEALRLCQ